MAGEAAPKTENKLMEGEASTELTFLPVELKVPTATWREILAMKMGKTIVWFWVLFWSVLLLLYFITTIDGIFISRNRNEIPGKVDCCCECLSPKFEIMMRELKDQQCHSNTEGYVNETNLGNTSVPKPVNVNIPEVAEKTPEVAGVNHEKTSCVPSRKTKSASLRSELTFGSKEGLATVAREPEYVINEEMTTMLVSWLIEVHRKFGLRQEVFYLTISIVDQFLSTKAVPKKELQLVGIASMLIACRYEEILAPELNDVLKISEEAYGREQVLAMEKAISRIL